MYVVAARGRAPDRTSCGGTEQQGTTVMRREALYVSRTVTTEDVDSIDSLDSGPHWGLVWGAGAGDLALDPGGGAQVSSNKGDSVRWAVAANGWVPDCSVV